MIAEASFLSSSILINSSARQLELIAKASFASCFIVKQNCCWEIVVRRMQGVHSIASINLYAEDREGFLSAYDAPMTFQIHFCLTIKYPQRVAISLTNYSGCFRRFLFVFRLLVGILSALFFCLSRLAFKDKTSNVLHNTQSMNRL